MFNFVWDYGSLPRQEEKEYIWKIIKSFTMKNQSQSALTDPEILSLSNAISEAHSFTKDREAEWAVSLRDVNRFT